MREIIYGTTSMKSKKIKPCPFCGGEATLRRDVRYPRPKCNPRQAWEVVCENNKCCVYDADTRYFFSAKAAILAWNDRKLGCEHEQMLADGELVSKEWHDEQIGHAELVIEEQRIELEEWAKLFDISNEREYRKKFNEEWKKEYQKKLNERGDGTIAGFPDFDLVYKLYFEQKTEIERLTEENAILKGNPPLVVGRSSGKTIRAKLLAFDQMKEQNAELQKQVDELKKSQVKHIHIDEQFKKECEYEIKQAVKDTAEEIIDALNGMKSTVREIYGASEQAGIDMAIKRVELYIQQKGAEVK